MLEYRPLVESDWEWVSKYYHAKPISYSKDGNKWYASTWDFVSGGSAVFKWDSDRAVWVSVGELHLHRLGINGEYRTLALSEPIGEDCCPQDSADDELPYLSKANFEKLGREFAPNNRSFWEPAKGTKYGRLVLDPPKT